METGLILKSLIVQAKLLCYHKESRYKNLVVYVCLNAVLIEFNLTRGICGRGLIKIRLGYHEESGSSLSLIHI